MRHIIAIGQQSLAIASSIRTWLPSGHHIEYYYHFLHSSCEEHTREKDLCHYFFSRVSSLWSEAYSDCDSLYESIDEHFQLNPADVILIYDAGDACGSGGASYMLDKLAEEYPTINVYMVPIFVTSSLTGISAINAMLSLHSAISFATAIVPRSLLDMSYLLALMKHTSFHLPLLCQLTASDLLHLLFLPTLPIISTNKIIDMRSATWHHLLKSSKRVVAPTTISQLHRRISSNMHAVDEYTVSSVTSPAKSLVRNAHIISTCSDVGDSIVGVLKGAASHVIWPLNIDTIPTTPPTIASPLSVPLATLCFTSPYALQQLQALVSAAEECINCGAFTHWFVKDGVSVEMLGLAVDTVKNYLQDASN